MIHKMMYYMMYNMMSYHAFICFNLRYLNIAIGTYSVVRSLSPVIAGLTRNPLLCCGGLWLESRNDFRRLNKYNNCSFCMCIPHKSHQNQRRDHRQPSSKNKRRGSAERIPKQSGYNASWQQRNTNYSRVQPEHSPFQVRR